ncbi:MAG: hypothetical protein ACOVP7_04870, partial [Lacibacter sp.]
LLYIQSYLIIYNKKQNSQRSMNCPKCSFLISKEQVNVTTDIAQCTRCGLVFKISDFLQFEDPHFNIDEPPPGIKIKNEFSRRIITATTRSYYAFFLIPFAAIWSVGSLNAIYGSQLRNGEVNIFLLLFGLPFIIGSIFLWKNAIMSSLGKVVIVTNDQGGEIFTGFGPLGITKTFEWESTSRIFKEQFYSSSFREDRTQIIIEGSRRIKFGDRLTDQRNDYVLKALQELKIKSNKIKHRY